MEAAGTSDKGGQPATGSELELQQVLSFECSRRSAVQAVGDTSVIAAVGRTLVLYDSGSLSQRYLVCPASIAAVAVHPSKQLLVLAGRCTADGSRPALYLYSYPGLELTGCLTGGTERSYSCVAFNSSGSMLAAVGSAPDYLLTLWDWEAGSIILRCKAFSQEVYAVKFSPFFQGNLTTCGTGHIRFWKMATTFTGLKLQGQLGKFGNVELSDIAAFLELPDGKVLSGSESGSLLLWDGGLIKVVINRPGGQPCHNGAVELLHHDATSNYVLSGGADGVLRLWDFNKLADADAAEGNSSTEVKPSVEVPLPAGMRVKGVVWLKGRWLVLDERGASYVVVPPLNMLDARSYTAGPLPDLTMGAVQHVLPGSSGASIITGAVNGTLSLLDLSTRQAMATRCCHAPITSLAKVPAGLDPQQRQLLVGTSDGVVRLVALCLDGWKLLQAWKPHAAAVCHVLVSPDGSSMVSTAADGSCFFFMQQAAAAAAAGSSDSPSWAPYASGKLPAPAVCCCWSGSGQELLVGSAGGEVFAITPPAPVEVEESSSRSFEQPLKYSRMRLQVSSTVVIPQPAAAAAAAAAAADASFSQENGSTAAPADGAGAADAAGTAAASAPADAAGSNAAPGDADAAAAPQPAAAAAAGPQVQVVYTDVTQRVTWIAPSPEDDTCFRACVAGSGAGQVWQYRIGVAQPLGQEELLLPSGTAVTVHSTSSCGRYRLTGGTGGVVQVQQLSSSGGSDSCWTSVLHDSAHGHLTAVVLTPDGQHLVTAAEDGTLLKLQAPNPAPPPAAAAAAAAPLPSTAHDGRQEAADINGADAPTLEQQQAAAKAQQAAAAAVAAREQRQQQLVALRKELERLMEENRSRPEGQRLPEEAFHIDPDLDQLVAQERVAALEEAAARLAWDTEAAQLRAAKLRQFFLASLATELVTLHPFSQGQPATTLRQAVLMPEVQAELDTLLGVRKSGDLHGDRGDQHHHKKQMHKQASRKGGSRSQGGAKAVSIQGASADHSGTSLGTHGADKGMCKGDARRAARAVREAQWAAFNATKPDDKYEAPADVAALAEAAATIGDYKLKSDPEYVLPEDQRLTPSKALQQWRQVSAKVAAAQQRHNNAVLALRDHKRTLLQRITSINQRLEVLNQQLGLTGGITSWALKPEEEPEVAREHVDPQQLQDYTARKAQQAAAKAAGAGGGFGGFASAAPGPPAATAAAGGGGAAAAPMRPPSRSKGPGAAAGAGPSGAHSSGSGAAAAAGVQLTDLELEEQEVQRLRAAAERKQLIAEVASMTSAFDAEVAVLRRQGLALALHLKLWEGQQLRLYQQLQLLKEFEKREVVLLAKHAAKSGEIEDLRGKMEGVDSDLADKRAEGDVLAAKRAEVVAQFEAAVAEAGDVKDALTKIFFKKIARRKNRSGNGGGEGGEEEDDAEDDDDDDLEDDEDDGEETCPPGCPAALYEQVRELREHRLDEEDAAGEVAKGVEGVRKEREILSKKMKLLEQSLGAINQDIHEFQKEKQARLNQLPVDVLLRLCQLEYLPGGSGKLPADLSGALVFDQQQLDALRRRMQTLDEERSALKQHQTELRRQHQALQAQQQEHQEALEATRARCADVQQLKFGGPIDTSLLDTLGVQHKGAVELRDQLRQQELRQAKELAGWEVKIQGQLQALVSLTKANTQALATVTTMTREQQGLETALLSNQRVLYEDPLDVRRRQVAERDALVGLVNRQAAEMEAVKMQVAALRRKGGYLPPVM